MIISASTYAVKKKKKRVALKMTFDVDDSSGLWTAQRSTYFDRASERASVSEILREEHAYCILPYSI